MEEKEKFPAGLYVVGTPIGNIEDITIRALETFRQADIIFAEDTRHTARLLDRHGIPRPRLRSCHRFNEASRVAEVLEWVQQGAVVVLVTNAGMPGISDPGARIVRGVRTAGLRVVVIPGPSAVTAALALSGYGWGEGFWFEGFLPRKSAARRRRLEWLAGLEVPAVLFESPYRLMDFLGDAVEVLGDRRMFVARELTKAFEEVIEGTPAELRDHFSRHPARGEFVIVLGP